MDGQVEFSSSGEWTASQYRRSPAVQPHILLSYYFRAREGPRTRRTEEASALPKLDPHLELDMQAHRPICRRMQVAESRGCAEPASQPLQRKSEERYKRASPASTHFSNYPSRYATSLADHPPASSLLSLNRRNRLIFHRLNKAHFERNLTSFHFHLVLPFSSGTPSIYHRIALHPLAESTITLHIGRHAHAITTRIGASLCPTISPKHRPQHQGRALVDPDAQAYQQSQAPFEQCPSAHALSHGNSRRRISDLVPHIAHVA